MLSMHTAFSTKAIDIMHQNHCSKHVKRKLVLQKTDIVGSISTTVRFDVGGYRTGARSCNRCCMMYFKDLMHLYSTCDMYCDQYKARGRQLYVSNLGVSDRRRLCFVRACLISQAHNAKHTPKIGAQITSRIVSAKLLIYSVNGNHRSLLHSDSEIKLNNT